MTAQQHGNLVVLAVIVLGVLVIFAPFLLSVLPL